MEFTFVRITHFTKLLKAGGRLREFNFRKINNMPEEGWFHIDVADDRGERIQFKLHGRGMLETNIFPPMPSWVEDSIIQLREVINTPEDYD